MIFAEEVLPEARAGQGHFGKAGEDGEDEIPAREVAEAEDDESDSDDGVEEKPECGVEGRIVEGGVGVDLGIDVIPLEPGEKEEEGGESVVKDLHFD